MPTPTPTLAETLEYDGHGEKLLFPTIFVPMNKKENPLDIKINNGNAHGIIYMVFGVEKEHRSIVKLPKDRMVTAHPMKHGTLHALIDAKRAEDLNVNEVRVSVTGVDCNVRGIIIIRFVTENEKEKVKTKSDSPRSEKSRKKEKKEKKEKREKKEKKEKN